MALRLILWYSQVQNRVVTVILGHVPGYRRSTLYSNYFTGQAVFNRYFVRAAGIKPGATRFAYVKIGEEQSAGLLIRCTTGKGGTTSMLPVKSELQRRETYSNGALDKYDVV